MERNENVSENSRIERQIIIGLITSTDYLKNVQEVWDYKFIESETARRLAEWCWEYFNKYGKAPGKDIQEIYFSKLKSGKLKKDFAEEIEQDILPSLSTEYTNDGIDKYLLDNTIHYFNYRQAEIYRDNISMALEKNELGAFYDLQATFKPIQLKTNEQRIKPSELYAMETKKVDWLIEDLIPRGLTIFGGASKLGKSYLTLNIIMNLAQGDWMFTDESEFGYRGEQVQILYLCLEDTNTRLANRMKSIDPNSDFKKLDPYLLIEKQWEKLNAGGLQRLKTLLKEKPHCKLVVIDVIEKLTSKSTRTGAGRFYTEEYTTYGPLSDLAHELGISIICITHTKKSSEKDVFNEILGGSGTYGPADTLMVLSRVPGSPEKRQLSIRCKDADDQHLTFQVSEAGANWICLGDRLEVQLTEQRESILNYLHTAGPKTYEEIRQAVEDGEIDVSINSVNTLLRRMIKSDLLEQDKRRGRYCVAGYREGRINASIADKLKKYHK
jgi:RecA-family ATPase